MRRSQLLSLLVVNLLGSSSPVAADPAAKPGKPQVAEILRAKLPKTQLHVSEVLSEIGDGRTPVLFTTSKKECFPHPAMSVKERAQARRDGDDPDICYQAVHPFLAMLRRQDKTLAVDAMVPLPTTRTPSADDEGKFVWGVSTIKDFDGDGKPELLVIYAYPGAVEPGLGTTSYRELALLNLELTPTVSANVVLRAAPEAESLESFEYKYKFQSAPGGPELVIDGEHRVEGEEQKPKKENRTYRYESGSDTWKLQEPPSPPKSGKPKGLSR